MLVAVNLSRTRNIYTIVGRKTFDTLFVYAEDVAVDRGAHSVFTLSRLHFIYLFVRRTDCTKGFEDLQREIKWISSK